MIHESRGYDMTTRCWLDVSGKPMAVGELDSLADAMRAGERAPTGTHIRDLATGRVLATMGRLGWDVVEYRAAS